MNREFNQHTGLQIAPVKCWKARGVLTGVDYTHDKAIAILAESHAIPESHCFSACILLHDLVLAGCQLGANGSIGIAPAGSPDGGTAPLLCQKH